MVTLTIVMVAAWVVRAGTATEWRKEVRAAWPPPCRFAPLYTMNELLLDEHARNTFIESAIYHEGHFHEIGYNHHSGIVPELDLYPSCFQCC
jgi:hypothetical protein